MLLLRMRYTCASKEYSPNDLLTMNGTIFSPAVFFDKEHKFRWLRHSVVIDYVQESQILSKRQAISRKNR